MWSQRRAVASFTVSARAKSSITSTRATFGTKAIVTVDGKQAYAPARTTYKGRGQAVPTPSVATGLTRDIYLTLGDPVPTESSDVARLSVSIKPMVAWMWAGGALMAVGTLLAAFPGRRRRRPTAPTSELAVPEDSGPPPAGELVTSRG